MNQKTKKMAAAALLAAFTAIATMVIKIPTPTFGYIHLGDSFVILCGIILGPAGGAFAAGIGSMFADIFSGYVSFAIPTLIIKALTAMTAGFIFHSFNHSARRPGNNLLRVFLCGLPAEAIMVLGYFAYELILLTIVAKEGSLIAGITAAAAGVPFNIVQGFVGIVIAAVLTPLLAQVRELREFITE